ncbi:MAG: ABC transporter permease [Cellulosilyticum sp.]|nr:ABC transporter permease [Cellulosilyticum sp.]
MAMNLNKIMRKLLQYNMKQYIVLIFCLIFGIGLFTSFGSVLFSQTVTQVIVDGGSTQQITRALYVIVAMGTSIFIGYAHTLYIKYRSREIGVLISLGLKKSDIQKMLAKELRYIAIVSSIIGVVISIPFTYLLWWAMSLFVQTKETLYHIGYKGIVYGCIYAIFITIILQIKTGHDLRRMDVLSILKVEDTIEEVSIQDYRLGIIGSIGIPISIYLWDRCFRGILFRSASYMSMIFGVITVVSIYMVAAQIATLGEMIRSISTKWYYKNIIFLNLLKVKGRQYTHALFTLIILWTITIFVLCNGLVPIIGAKEIANKNMPYDFEIEKSIDQNTNISNEDILEIAQRSHISIDEYDEVELLIMAYPKKFGKVIEMSEMYCIDERSYERLYGECLEVGSNEYIAFNGEKDMLEKLGSVLSISVIGQEKVYPLQCKGTYQKCLFSSDVALNIFVLNHETYERFKSLSFKEAIESVIVLKVEKWENSQQLHDLLVQEMLNANKKQGLKMNGSIAECTYFGQKKEYASIEELSPSVYRWWRYRPNTKIYNTTYATQDYAVYALLFIYIGLLTSVASAIILHIKVLNTFWQDQIVYKNITLLGTTKKGIKEMMTRQLLLIFLMPIVLGTITSLSLVYAFYGMTLSAFIYMKYCIIFVFIYAMIQMVMFLITRSSLMKRTFS